MESKKQSLQEGITITNWFPPVHTQVCSSGQIIWEQNTGNTQGSPWERHLSPITRIHRDVSWFNAFLPDFNGRVYFDKHSKPPVNNMFVDASLSGVWGIWEESVYAILSGFIQGLPLHCTIVLFKMINVFIALKVWKHKLQGRTIVIHCDNIAVVNSILWDSFLGSVARNIIMAPHSYPRYWSHSHSYPCQEKY